MTRIGIKIIRVKVSRLQFGMRARRVVSPRKGKDIESGDGSESVFTLEILILPPVNAMTVYT